MLTVATFRHVDQAHALRVALESQGIPAAVQGEHAVGSIAGAIAVVILDAADADRARAVLERFTGGSPGGGA